MEAVIRTAALSKHYGRRRGLKSLDLEVHTGGMGAASGRRAWAAGAVAAVGVLTYFATTLGPSIEGLAWTRDLSPFHYYSGGQPLRNGLRAVDAIVLTAAIVVLVALAVVAFRRRDIAV